MASGNDIPQVVFSCNQPKVGSIDTPNRIDADVTYERRVYSDKVTAPDGSSVRWGLS